MAVMRAYFINETKAVAKAAALFVEKEEKLWLNVSQMAQLFADRVATAYR